MTELCQIALDINSGEVYMYDMSGGRPKGAEGEPQGGPQNSDITDLIGCILARFNHVSVPRVHNLAYLIEHEVWSEVDERLTDTTYSRYLRGVFSDQISSELDSIDGIEIKQVTVDGDDIPTVDVGKQYDCAPPELNEEYDISDTIDEIVAQFGGVKQAEVQAKLRSTEPYSRAGVGEEIDWSIRDTKSTSRQYNPEEVAIE